MVKTQSIATTVRRVTVIVLIAILITACIPVPAYAQPLDYPYQLVPGDPRLDFPEAEGRQLDMTSDSWFMEGFLEGKDTGNQYAFITIYYVTDLFWGLLPFLHFYSTALYNLDTGDYGTYTSWSNVDATAGYLDLSVSAGEEEAIWTTAIDENSDLIPFNYNVDFPGIDQQGRYMRLTADVESCKPPVPVGADTYNGVIEVFKQPGTYSYFQTRLEIEGTLTWGDITEEVTGNIGHIDRQMFPAFTGTVAGLDGRNIPHEWRTYSLDNGIDISTWRMFDRMNKNVEICFNGATVVDEFDNASYVDDFVYENLSYRRVQNHPIQPLMPPRSPILYYPDKHRMSSESLDLQLETEPLMVETPLLAFPIEYVHGPVLLTGTMNGTAIEGIGSFERTLSLYRDWELAKVLSDTITHLPMEAFVQPSGSNKQAILQTISQMAIKINNNNNVCALWDATFKVHPKINTLMVEPYRSEMLQILSDVARVIGWYPFHN